MGILEPTFPPRKVGCKNQKGFNKFKKSHEKGHQAQQTCVLLSIKMFITSQISHARNTRGHRLKLKKLCCNIKISMNFSSRVFFFLFDE